jgi:hypothetical protein
MSERQGVEIDYCPKCRGVWLDRGELDKIIEKSTAITGRQNSEQVDDDDDDDDRFRQERKDLNQGDPNQQRRKRRGGFLGDFFDFD